MRNKIILYILAILLPALVAAQIHVVKPVKALPEKKESSFGIGAGFTRSVVYLPRNTQNNNDARGKSLILTYDKGNLIRYTLEYTNYRAINFAPTWYNVKAACIEANVHFIARFGDDRSYFFPIVGISYNQFSGHFTGKNDYFNLRSIYEPGTTIRSNWFGINAGTGYEYHFKNSAIYLTQKMRVGYTEGNDQYNIQDLCFTAGYRVFISGTKLNHFFRGTRSRYVLSKPKKKN